MKNLWKTVGIIFIATLTQCSGDCLKSSRCKLVPETGPCEALFTKYYYDKEEKKCKPFTWGGCDGVVPFNTLEECNNKCSCE